MIVYVQRSNGKIVGVYANPQPGYAEEAIDDSNPEVIAFFNPPPPTPEEQTATARNKAEIYATAKEGITQLIRAELLLTMDELNILRNWITSFKAAVAAAASLEDLKNKVAALPNTPGRTASQIKPALITRIRTPDAD